jgi:hypothetical protein
VIMNSEARHFMAVLESHRYQFYPFQIFATAAFIDQIFFQDSVEEKEEEVEYSPQFFS